MRSAARIALAIGIYLSLRHYAGDQFLYGWISCAVWLGLRDLIPDRQSNDEEAA
jgi:hypothetical protein